MAKLSIGEDKWCVYEHVFPNGKKYVGITNNTQRRFGKDGSRYKTNTEMYEEIKKVGWGNVKHNILAEGLTRSQAQALEKETIAKERLIETGYNKTVGGEINTSYYSRSVNKVLGIMHNYGKSYPILQRQLDGYKTLGENEDNAIHINYADLFLRQNVPGYKEWMSEDPATFCVHWCSNIMYLVFQGGNPSEIKHFAEITNKNKRNFSYEIFAEGTS